MENEIERESMNKIFQHMDFNENDKVTPNEFQDWKLTLERNQSLTPAAGWLVKWDRHKKEYRFFKSKEKALDASNPFGDIDNIIGSKRHKKYITYELDASLTHDQADSHRWGVFIPRLAYKPAKGKRLKKKRFANYDEDNIPTGYWYPLDPEEVDFNEVDVEDWRKTLPKPESIQKQIVPTHHLNLIFQLLSCMFLKAMTDCDDDSPLMTELVNENEKSCINRSTTTALNIVSKRSMTDSPIIFRIEQQKYRMTFWNQKNKIRFVKMPRFSVKCSES